MTIRLEVIGPGPHATLPRAACKNCGGVRWWTSRERRGTGWRCLACCQPVSTQMGLLRIEEARPRPIVPPAA